MVGQLNAVAERDAVQAVLRAQRAHVLRAVSGLSDTALRQPVLPSGWSCLGLVQHLALDVERFWFRAVAAGEAVVLCSGAEAWQVDAATPVEAVIEAYHEEIRAADAAIARIPLDASPAWWPGEDVPAVSAFYRDALQLREVFRDDVSTVFGLGGTTLNVLAVAAAFEVVAPVRPAPLGTTPRMLLSLWVEDVDAVCQELQERGVVLLNGPVDRAWGKRTAAYMDPAGAVWEIAQDIA